MFTVLPPVPSTAPATQQMPSKHMLDHLRTLTSRPSLAVALATQAGWYDVPILRWVNRGPERLACRHKAGACQWRSKHTKIHLLMTMLGAHATEPAERINTCV